jgi:uncharacterized protein (DUF885 family)
MKSYFSDATAAGILGLNNLMDLATSTLGDFVKENPERKAEVVPDVRLIKSQKLGSHDAEIEKIKNTFVAILKDIKKDMAEGETQEITATAEFMQKVQEELLSLPPEQRTSEDAADVLVRMVEQAAPLDDATKVLYRQLAEGLFQNFGAAPAEGDSKTEKDISG